MLDAKDMEEMQGVQPCPVAAPSLWGAQNGGEPIVPPKGLVGPKDILEAVCKLSLRNLKSSGDSKIDESIVG